MAFCKKNIDQEKKMPVRNIRISPKWTVEFRPVIAELSELHHDESQNLKVGAKSRFCSVTDTPAT
jgi:hypothetical protein